MKKIILISTILCVIAGCKKGPVAVVKDPGPAQLPAGWQLAESSDKTVSMAIAPGWRRGGAGSMNVMDMATSGMGVEGTAQDNGFSQQMEKEQQANDAEVAAELEKKGIVISCIDGSRPIPGEARNQYMVKREKKGPMSLEDAAKDEKEHLVNEGEPKYIDLPIGKAAYFHAVEEMKDGGTVTKIAYVICNGEDVYTITFVTEAQASIIEQIAEPVIATLRIKPAKS